MTLVNDMLALAGQLAVLTFYTGVLIYMLPLPMRRIKHLAPTLMEDGILAALLISLFTTILYISDYIASYSSFTLAEVLDYIHWFFNTIMQRYLQGKSSMALLSLLPYMHPNFLLAQFLTTFIVFGGVVSASLTAIALISVIMKLKAELAAIGVMLYSLPLRLGRSAGASLIAFVVVMNVALHFLPYWISTVGQAIGDTTLSLQKYKNAGHVEYNEYGEYNFWGTIRDRRGVPAPYAVVEIANSTMHYATMADSNGVYIVYKKGLSKGKYYFRVNYLGIIFTSGYIDTIYLPEDLDLTYESSITPYRFDVTAPYNVLFLQPQGILYTTCIIDPDTAKTSRGYFYDIPVKIINVRCLALSEKVTVYASFAENCHLVDINITNTVNKLIDVKDIDWYNTKVTLYEYDIQLNGSGWETLSLSYYCDQGARLAKPGIDIEEEILHYDLKDANAVLAIGVAYTVAVFSYVTLAGLAVRDVARFLGARSPSVVIHGRL